MSGRSDVISTYNNKQDHQRQHHYKHIRVDSARHANDTQYQQGALKIYKQNIYKQP